MENPLDNSRYIIQLIKSKPILWNIRDVNYTNRQVNEKTWFEVAETLRVTVGDVKAKWNVLRNSYARSIRQDNVDPDKPRSPWYLEDDMNFLREYVQHRFTRRKFPKLLKTATKSNKSNNQIIEDDEVILIESPEAIIEIRSESPEPEPSTSKSPAPSTVSATSPKPPPSPLPSTSPSTNQNDYDNIDNIENITLIKTEEDLIKSTSLVRSIKRSRSLSNEYDDNVNNEFYHKQHHKQQPNSDSLFFQSIELDFMKLPIKNKRKFKTAVMNIMMELLNETDDQKYNFDHTYDTLNKL